MSLPTLNQSWNHRLSEGWWARTTTGAGLVIPDGRIDVMCVDGGAPFIAGPDTRPTEVQLAAGSRVLGLRLRHGAATAAFGESAATLVDQRVPLSSLWSREAAARVTDELAAARSDAEVALLLASALGRSAGNDWLPHPVVDSMVKQIAHQAAPKVPSLSERQRRRLFTDAIGYGPKTFDRICRLNRFLDAAAVEPQRSLARTATEAGYYDEAHLCRETARLAQRTPSELVLANQ